MTKSMKIVGYLGALALLLLVIYQPWTYNVYGFDEVTIALAGGEIKFNLINQASSRSKKSYCLFSTFRTNDKPGEQVAITIDRVGTKSVPELRVRIENAGRTLSIHGSANPPSYFDPPGISKLAFPSDEALEVVGSLRYRGASHPFQTVLKLKYWERSREVTKFCV